MTAAIDITEPSSLIVDFINIKLKKSQKIVDRKTAIEVFSGILAALPLAIGCEKVGSATARRT